MFHIAFYLKEFFRHFKKNVFWGSLYTFTTVSLVAMLACQTNVQEQISQNIKLEKSFSYFHTLISSRHNHSRVARKLRDLPGIQRVEELSESKIRSEVEKLMGSLDLNVSSDVNLSFAGLKVILNSGLEGRSFDLVRNYIQRLVGKSNVTLGPVVKSEAPKKSKQGVLKVLSEWGVWLLVGVLGFFWLLSGICLSFKSRDYAYILEQFQRKENIAFKMMLTGSLFIVGSAVLVAIVLVPSQSVNVLPVLLVSTLVPLINLRSYRWDAA